MSLEKKALGNAIAIKHQRQMKTKKCLNSCVNQGPSCGFTILATAFVVVIAMTTVLWTTDIMKMVLDKNLLVKNHTDFFNMWAKPPVRPLMGVYVFNYTNVEAYETGVDKKLKVEEVGPFVYRETMEKVNIVFNDNGTVTYQQKSSFDFVPELSKGYKPRETHITVPNLPLLSAMSVMKDMYLLTQLAFLAVSRTLETRQFVHLTAHDFFWGYDDRLFDLARTYASFSQPLPYKKFGLLAKNWMNHDRVTMYTGVQDPEKLGVVSRVNGQSQMHHWSGECNRIDGTDGGVYPRQTVNRDSRLYIYTPEMCRKVPLEYTADVIAQGMYPALRYRPPRDVFANPDVNPDNACFCHPDSDFCPPSGVYNASPCAYGAPVMMSFPHFFLGDPKLLETVDGLKPDPEKHDMYTDMHETMGVPLDGKSRLQVNMLVRKSSTFNQLAKFKDGSILPIAWFDVGVDGLPEEVRDVVYLVTFTGPRVIMALQYGLLLLSIILLYLLVRRIRNHQKVAVAPVNPV